MTTGQGRERWIALAFFTAVALYLCWSMLSPFVDVLIWASVLVMVFFPIHKRIEARVHKPGLSAFLSILLVSAVVIVPVTIISSAVVVQLAGMKEGLQNQVHAFLDDPQGGTKLHALLEKVNRYVNLKGVLSPDNLKQVLSSASETVVRGTLSVVGGVIGFIVTVFLVLFTMFYLFRDGEKIAERIPDMLPLSRVQAEAMIFRTTEMIQASVVGILVIAMVQGTLGGLMFWTLGIPSALLWGVLMTVLSTIPVAGAYVVWVPAALWLGLTGHWVKAGLLTAFGVLVVGMVDNLLRPRMVGRRTQMSELYIFFAILGGLHVFGFLGLLLGPVVVSITIALLEVFWTQGEASATESAAPASQESSAE